MPNTATLVAIAGATGYIGGRLAPRLIADGYKERCLVRSAEKLSGRDWAASPKLEVRQVDLTAGSSLAENLAGCDAAFYLVHSMTSAGKKYAEQGSAASFVIRRGRQRGGSQENHLSGRPGRNWSRLE